MLQYSKISDRILSGGIDQDSSETSVKEGFVEDALNMDVESDGLARRKGFEVFAGDMPLRAETLITDDTAGAQTIQLLLPSYVNLANVTRGPLRIQGSFVYNSGATTVTFGGSELTDVPAYYEAYIKPDFFTLEQAATSTTLVATNTGITTIQRLIGVQTVVDDSVYIPDSISIDTTGIAYETTITYDVTEDTDTYLYSQPCEVDTYYMPYALGVFTPETFLETSPNVWECTIDEATLNLPNLNIIPQFYSEAAGVVTTQLVDAFTIDGATAAVTFTIHADAAPTTFIPLLCTTTHPAKEGTTAGTVGTTTVTIENAESPHLFAACYLEDPVTGDLELVLPNSILYDATSEAHTISFTHPNFDLSYKIVYEYGYNLTNQVIIEMPAGNPLTASETITEANVVIHGFKQSELPVKTFVNFIDGHRKSDRVVTGADGLLFTSQVDTYSEEVDLRRRIAGPLNVGPLFVDSTPVLPRTEGNIITPGAINGHVRVTQVGYTGTASNVAYLLAAPGHGLVDGNPIHSAYDRLTVSKLTQSRFNGNFEILSSSVIDADNILVTVDNPSITNSIWDLPSSYGLAGIFTDKLTFLNARPLAFEVGDKIALSDVSLVTVSSLVDGDAFSIIVDEVMEPMKLATGLRLGPTRVDSSFYLNTWSNDLVIGDIIYFDDTPTQLIAVDPVTQIITLRESLPLVEGLATISRPFKWLLIPSPLGEDVISRTEIISSVAGAGSIYLSNGIKYDGSKILKSGLPSLQNHLFVTVDEVDAGIAIPIQRSAFTAIVNATLTMTVPDSKTWLPKDVGVIRRELKAPGTTTEVDTETLYIVDSVDIVDGKITLNANPTHLEFTPAADVFDFATYDYYFTKFTDLSYYVRLRYVDDNGSVAVGPSTGEQDIRVRLTQSATVHIRAQVFPDNGGLYDYENIQLDLYRRLPSRDQTSYRVDSKTLDSTSARYIDFRDTRTIGDGTNAEIDPVTSPSLGRIGESRSAPPFAADWITSINNQIVYGGITTEPAAYIVLNGAGVSDSDLVGHVWEVDGTAYKVVDPATKADLVPANITIPVVPNDTTILNNAALAAAVVAGDVIYIANTNVTSTAATTKLLGWFTVKSVTAPNVIINTPGITALTAYEDLNLTAYFATGFIPLAGNIRHYNIGQSISRSTSVIRLFPFHLASAITWTQIEDGIYARGGYDLEEGLIKVVSDIAGIEVKLPDFTAITNELTVFGNDRPAEPLDSILTRSTRYGSRIALSTKNFPEVFEDLDTPLGRDAPLIADIAPEDGESTNGGIPFFATAAFGAAQQTSILTIFKPHSIYIMDAQAKYVNKGEILKQIQSNGIGCEAPKSLVTASDGVWFASRGGMYMLDRSLTVRYTGLYLERLWQSQLVDRSLLTRCAGSNYSVERKYRLSFPTLTEEKWTSGVFNFKAPDDISAEESVVQGGRWTRYGDEFSATLWANLTDTTLFSSSEGFVGVLKNTSSTVDYSDAGSDIAGEITFRAMDFGLPDTKKVLRHFSIYYRTQSDFEAGDILLQTAVDLNTVFQNSEVAKVNGFEESDPNLLGDVNRRKLDSLQYSPVVSKCTWFQLKLQVSGVNKDLYIDRVIYKVARVRTRGVEQAGERD